MFTDAKLAQIRADTPGLKSATHLLAAGSSLMPQPVVDAVIEHTKLEAQYGGYAAYDMRAEELGRVYSLVARHIGASASEVAITENATLAWSYAFYALPLSAGTRILTCEAEYAANYVALLQRAKKDKLTIEVVPSDASGELDLDALERMIDSDVGLVAITWVPSNGGLVNPAAEVGRICKKHSVPYLLDACQAVGQMEVDVTQLNCDFLSATGRKFLRGPRGIGFLYLKSKWLKKLEPVMLDHFAAPLVSLERYKLRDDARRFESWETSYALRAGLAAAIEYADELGMANIARRVTSLAERCRERLSEVDGVEVQDLGTQRCAIVSFSVHDHDPDSLVQQLAGAGFVIGTSSPMSTILDAQRRGLSTLLRIAPHYYNTESDIEQCVNHIKRLL